MLTWVKGNFSTEKRIHMTAAPLHVFISYSHRDEKLREDLGTHLSTLQWQGVIHSWHDRRITAGSEWAGAIDASLNTADIILLLISANFLASDYCNDIELKRALERHERGEARVIPIILKPSDWATTSLGGLQALPTNAKAVTTWSNRDQAFLEITQGIRLVALEMEESQGQSGPLGVKTPPEPGFIMNLISAYPWILIGPYTNWFPEFS